MNLLNENPFFLLNKVNQRFNTLTISCPDKNSSDLHESPGGQMFHQNIKILIQTDQQNHNKDDNKLEKQIQEFRQSDSNESNKIKRISFRTESWKWICSDIFFGWDTICCRNAGCHISKSILRDDDCFPSWFTGFSSFLWKWASGERTIGGVLHLPPCLPSVSLLCVSGAFGYNMWPSSVGDVRLVAMETAQVIRDPPTHTQPAAITWLIYHHIRAPNNDFTVSMATTPSTDEGHKP